jgi:hypothetical protein
VDAEEEKSFSYDDLKDEQLPEDLKGKSKDEIKSYIEKKRIERKKLQQEIAELNIKRRDYVSSKSTNTNNGLENALIKAIKAQAKLKNYRWE